MVELRTAKTCPTLCETERITGEETMREMIVGLDCGNHWTKVYFQGPDGEEKKVVKASSLATRSNSHVTLGSPDSFAVESGPALRNGIWDVWSTNPIYDLFQVVVADQDGRGKPIYALPLFISAMWEHLEDGDCIQMVASVHDKNAYGDDMKRALSGVHTIRYTDEDEETERKTFCITVENVVYESAGVIFGQEKKPLKSLILDIGGGTVLANPMNKARLAYDNVVEFADCGVKSLLGLMTVCGDLKTAIRSDQELAKHYSRLMSNEGLMEMLKAKGVFKIGSHKLDVSEIIRPVVEKWLYRLESELNQSEVASYLSEPGREKLITGGGSLVPGVKEWAKERGFKSVSSPQFANAYGLFKLAKRACEADAKKPARV
jgi:hypothetical protein